MKKKTLLLIIMIIISIFSLIFVYNDDFLYKEKIIKITNIKKIKEDTSINNLGIKEKYTTKEIKGVITNTKDKGKEITVKYEESSSSVITDKYKINDKVFIKDNNIKGLKRDFYICTMLIIFIISLYLVGSYKGLLSIISVIINTTIFYLGLLFYFKGANLLIISIIESILFTTISLFIAEGINKKTSVAVLSTITTSLVVLIITYIVIKQTKYSGLNFNELSFLTVPVEDIIIPELFIGILGASMDVAITISSSISELISKNPKITNKQLRKSAKEIGKDIMSTMSNVLFFTYICSGLPIFILAIRNGFSFYNYLTTNISLEISRFLVGSIGIILTIPITTYLSIKIYKEVSK